MRVLRLVLFASPLFLVMKAAAPSPKRTPSSTTSFLCIPDYSVGYAKTSGEWGPTHFRTEGRRYLLVSRGGAWFWNEFGDPKPAYDHRTQCGKFNDYGFLDCRHFEEEVLFNRRSLRFTVVQRYGYVVADLAVDSAVETPFLEIGKCSPVN